MKMSNRNGKASALDHVSEKLGAYLDGELYGRSYQNIQAHLETCQTCRDELDELRRVSKLLHNAPLPEFTPARRFTSQLILQLPRRNSVSQPRGNFRFVGLLFPVVLLLAWVFVQTTVGMTFLFSIAQQVSLLSDSVTWFSSAPRQMSWFVAFQFVFGDTLSLSGLSGFQSLNDTNLLLKGLIGPLILQLVLVGLYLAWLLVWLQNKYVVEKGSVL